MSPVRNRGRLVYKLMIYPNELNIINNHNLGRGF